MRPKIKLVDEPGRAAIKAALAEATDPALRRRLHAVRLAFRGQHTLAEIAETLDCARSSVAEYIRRFRTDGVAGLHLKPRGGAREKRTKVDAATTAELLAGLRQGRWKRAKEIRHWLADKRGTRLSLAGVYTWLRRRGAKPKVPRKSHGKQDPAKTAAFKTQLAAELGALGLPPTAKVRLWVANEHRYGLIGVIRKVWSLRGVKWTAKARPRRCSRRASTSTGAAPSWPSSPPPIRRAITLSSGTRLAGIRPSPAPACPSGCGSCRCHPTARNSTRWRNSAT